MTAHFDHDAGPAPCDTCDLAERCATRLLACESFRRYTRLERWQAAPREPTRERFQAIYQPRVVDEAVLARLREMKRQTKAERGTRDGRRPRANLSDDEFQAIDSTEKIPAPARKCAPAMEAIAC